MLHPNNHPCHIKLIPSTSLSFFSSFSTTVKENEKEGTSHSHPEFHSFCSEREGARRWLSNVTAVFGLALGPRFTIRRQVQWLLAAVAVAMLVLSNAGTRGVMKIITIYHSCTV